MKELLEEYRAVIEQYHPELSKALRPGLPRDLVIEKLSLRLHFPISEDAIQLYSWADGIDLSKGEPHVIPYSFFMPLESAINLFETQVCEGAGASEKYGDSFKFLSDGSDGGYAFGSLDEPCNGQIICHVPHDEWIVGFRSLSDMIETLIEAYKRGLVDEDGQWSRIQFSDLVDELNPELKTKTDDSKIEISPPDGWYLSSDRTSLSKGETTAFMTEVDADRFEDLRCQFSKNIGEMRARGITECLESEIRFPDSGGWKFIFSRIEVSELLQINYLLAVSGRHVWVRVNSDVIVFDEVEFESALETLKLTASANSG
ncbi:hypothetical protein N9Y42_00090 [Mariniblastus sp.]|nr:hypothetical protein [Mariniblastus sp.]